MKKQNVLIGITLAITIWLLFWNVPADMVTDCCQYCYTPVQLCPPSCSAGIYTLAEKACCPVSHTGCNTCYVKWKYDAGCVKIVPPGEPFELCDPPSFTWYWTCIEGSGDNSCCCCKEIATGNWLCYHPCNNPAMCSG